MPERPVGRPPIYDSTDLRYIAEVETLMREKRVHSFTEGFHLIAEGSGLSSECRKRAFAERLRRKMKRQRSEIRNAKQGTAT